MSQAVSLPRWKRLRCFTPTGDRYQGRSVNSKLCEGHFEQEVRRSQPRTPGVRPTPSAFLSYFLDVIPHGLAYGQQIVLTKHVLLLSMALPNTPLQDIMLNLHQVANHFAALCLDEFWTREKVQVATTSR
jgi:transformation/transcription domain-associated protein